MGMKPFIVFSLCILLSVCSAQIHNNSDERGAVPPSPYVSENQSTEELLSENNKTESKNWVKSSTTKAKKAATWVFDCFESTVDLFSHVASHSAKQVEDKYNLQYPYNILALTFGTLLLLAFGSRLFSRITTRNVETVPIKADMALDKELIQQKLLDLSRKIDELQTKVNDLTKPKSVPIEDVETPARSEADIDLNVVLNEHHKMQMELIGAISRTQGTIFDRLKVLESAVGKKRSAGGAASTISQSVYVYFFLYLIYRLHIIHK